MTDVKMPEPTYIWHEDRDDETSCEMYEVAVSGLVDTNDEIYANGKCNLCTRLFTEAQMLQFRRDALEEAAIEVKTEADYSGSNRQAVLMWAVNIIRKLKETK